MAPFTLKSLPWVIFITGTLQDVRSFAFKRLDRSELDEVTRIWAAIKREALLTAAEGIRIPAKIDSIFRAVLKTPKGPFEQMDIVGLDVVYDIEQHFADARAGIPVFSF